MNALDVLRDLFPLSVPRGVSPRHVECFADFVLRAPGGVVDDVSEEAKIAAASRGALRLAGVYVPFERGLA